MNTLGSEKLATPCHFRADGVMCLNGLLYYSKEEVTADPARVAEMAKKHPEDASHVSYYKPILMESEPVTCSACEGKGMILTERGKELLVFFDTFLRAQVYEMCSDYIDDKMGLT